MTYQHTDTAGRAIGLPVGKVVCVGRNYAAHARELGNAVPDAPILFLKPSTALVPLQPSFAIPQGRGECHHETEICVLIGKTLSGEVTEAQARAAIWGLGIGLDLTLRDVQNQLKAKGYPWEVAKAFDGAAPMGPFEPLAANTDLTQLSLGLRVNGEQRQQGSSADMITPILPLLCYIAEIFTLQPGDIVMTGTPEGVAALQAGDELGLNLGAKTWSSRVS